jgi:hypothetical protein
MYKVVATGNRDWPEAGRDMVESILIMLKNRYATSGKLPLVIHGGAKGFDTQVEAVCQKLHIQTEVWLPEYTLYGNEAPLIRNDNMLQEKPDLVLVGLHNNKTHSGTLYTMKKAREAGLFVLALYLPQV